MQRNGLKISSTRDTSQGEMLTPVQLSMFEPTICAVTSNVISLLASGDGLSHSGAPDGPTIAQDGLQAAPAPHGAEPASGTVAALVPTTSATCGQYSSRSLKPSGQSRSMGNKSPGKRRSPGSTGQKRTSKNATTSLGDRSAEPPTTDRRRDANGSIFLPTLSAREGKDWSRAEVLARLDRGDGVAKRICALSPSLPSSPGIVGLNPSFAAAMMGFPPEWHSCAPTEMLSTRGSRRSLSPKPEAE